MEMRDYFSLETISLINELLADFTASDFDKATEDA